MRNKDRPYGDGGNEMVKVERSVVKDKNLKKDGFNYDPNDDLKELGDIS